MKKRGMRYFIVFISSWLAGYLALRLHWAVHMGIKVGQDELRVVLISFVVLELLSLLVYAPAMVAVAKMISTARRPQVQIVAALVLGFVVPTLGALRFSHFNVFSSYYYFRAWNVYLYFGTFSLVFALGWIWAERLGGKD